LEELKVMNQAHDIKDRGVRSSGLPKHQVPCESALRELGVDAAFIAQRLVNMFDAKGKRWNPATKSYETFEDYVTQLAAIKEVAKLLGLEPTQKELEARHRPQEVVIRVVQDEQLVKPRAGHQ